MKKLLCMLTILLATGCASSYKLHGEKPESPTGKYSFKPGNVELVLSSEKQPEGYMDASQLKDMLSEQLVAHMKEKGIYDENSNLSADIVVNYQRNFSYGDALAKPSFGYDIIILNNREKLATRSVSGQTTYYGYFGDAAVNLQVGTGTWDEEDEPQDIDMVALSLSNDLEEF